MYIEPCCIDKQLPKLIRESRSGYCFFQTNGDVTLEKLLGAVSHLAGNEHTIVLTVAEVDIQMLRTLAYYFRRGWTRGLLLLTSINQRELIEGELQEYLPRVHYAVDPLVIDGQLAVIGLKTTTDPEPKALIVQGAMLGQADFSLSMYAAYLGKDIEAIRSALDPVVAKLKTKAVISHAEEPVVADIINRKFRFSS